MSEIPEPERTIASAPEEAGASGLGRMVVVNIVVAVVASLATYWLAGALPGWPRTQTNTFVYVLMFPFVVFPPLCAVVSLALGARSVRRVEPRAGKIALALALLATAALALDAILSFVPALRIAMQM